MYTTSVALATDGSMPFSAYIIIIISRKEKEHVPVICLGPKTCYARVIQFSSCISKQRFGLGPQGKVQYQAGSNLTASSYIISQVYTSCKGLPAIM